MIDAGLEIAEGVANTRAGKVHAAGWDACAALPGGRAAGDPRPQACAFTGWVEAARSFSTLGVWLAWGFLNGSLEVRGFCMKTLMGDRRSVQEADSRHRPLLPLQVPGPCTVWALEGRAWDGVVVTRELSEDCWLYCSCRAINWLAGYSDFDLRRSRGTTAGRKCDNESLEHLREQIRVLLARDCVSDFVPRSLMSELRAARINYSGEEILPLRPLCVEQMSAALPPPGAGGRVNVLDLVDGGVRESLLHPERCLVDCKLRTECPRQAKVHIAPGEEKAVAKLLIDRGVCKPLPSSSVAKVDGVRILNSVAKVDGVRILNGLFGVPKPKYLEDGRPILRTIMNLIPVNGLQRTIEGHVGSLPNIAAWQSIILGSDEKLYCYQSDMACAFYLFSLPDCWLPWFSLNMSFDGVDVGCEPGVKYTVACCTLPMGWRSAVGIMQNISRNVLLQSQLPASSEVRKNRIVPKWMIECWRKGGSNGWWQVYLDNFVSTEVRGTDEGAGAGKVHFERSQWAWDSAGILCAADKNVEEALLAFELGAELDGQFGKLSGGTLRLLKACQASLSFILNKKGGGKELQVLGGRWAFLAQFRRPVFACFNDLWRSIYADCPKPLIIARASFELLMGCCLAPLVGADLKRPVSDIVIASDASESGGAFCIGQEASWSGSSLASFLECPGAGPTEIPVLVISLFNGIGGAFRAYDILGLAPVGLVAVECSKPANRVTSQAWPHSIILTDVGEVTQDVNDEWANMFSFVQEVHLWGGFPCVHLSSVRHNRLNLAGEGSHLFYTLVQIRDWLWTSFSSFATVRWVVENVASMDVSARDEISRVLGVEPFRLDPADVLCFSRPRFAWCSEWAGERNDVFVTKRKGFIEVVMSADSPQDECWIQPGWRRVSFCKLPTFMKSLPRDRPPSSPAGLGRTPSDAVARWENDSYRFPPYQYKEQFLLTDGTDVRYPNSSERELLMGFGVKHTFLCLPASQSKRSKTVLEDTRLSLIGDSFAIISFAWVAGLLCRRYQAEPDIETLVGRLGLAPGHSARLSVRATLSRFKNFGDLPRTPNPTTTLAHHLCRVANHTGSDVRITTGEIIRPKAVRRAGVDAICWRWKQVYSTRWQYSHHINALEMRALLLALQWRSTRPGHLGKRIVHLVDSLVTLCICCKGRTSSKMLSALSKKIAAYVLAMSVNLVLAHVDSAINPADKGSRV